MLLMDISSIKDTSFTSGWVSISEEGVKATEYVLSLTRLVLLAHGKEARAAEQNRAGWYHQPIAVPWSLDV